MNGKRLESLDILRGFDLWLLLFIGPIAGALCSCTQGPVRDFIRVQTSHPAWGGFVLWDIIMPLFIFMSGITIPFSMAKYRKGQRPDSGFWLKLAKRFFLLFFLGWIVQGNLLAFDWKVFHPFANTLQAIAVGYVVAAIAYVYGGVKGQTVVASLFFLAYFLIFALNGQLDPDTQENVAMWVDKAVLGCHRDGVKWAEDGTWIYKESYRYTWILSSLNFSVTAILGCLTGAHLRNSKKTPGKRALGLALVSALLVASGLALDLVNPINKKIWNSSMTLYSGGICGLMMALSYFIVDVKGWKKGLGWLKYYGCNSITAYCIGEVISFTSVSNSIFFGFKQWMPECFPILIAVSNVTILFLILRILYKRGIFLKV